MASNAIRGVTFSNQKVTAVDHGVLFAKILSDGIIKGCSISYSGRNVTIGEGYIIVAGREIHFTGSNTISLSGSENYPWVRIKIRINTNLVASLTAFDQVSIEVDYANTYEGLPELIKEDVNNKGGHIYEANLATLKMTNGAFSSLYSKMQSSGQASVAKAVSVTIPVNAWNSKVANVNVEGVTPYTSSCHPIVSPNPTSWAEWNSCGIRATSQGSNTLRFECSTTPTKSVTANILIIYT